MTDEEQRERLRELAKEAKRRQAATQRRDELVVELRDAKVTFRAIADAAGLTPHAIEKIVARRASTST